MNEQSNILDTGKNANSGLFSDHRLLSGYQGEGVPASNKPEWLKRLESKRHHETYNKPVYSGLSAESVKFNKG